MHRSLALAVITTAVLLAACSGTDSSTAPGNAAVVGSWNLQTVNGKPLPYTAYASASDTVQMTGDVITAAAAGTFTDVASLRMAQNGQVTTQTSPNSGTFVTSGSQVTFHYPADSINTIGTISGRTLTVNDQATGVVMVYTKQ